MNAKEKAIDYLKRAYHMSYFEQPIEEMLDIAIQQAKQDMAERIKKEIEGIENIYSKTYTDKVFEIIDKALENKDNFQASKHKVLKEMK